MSKKKSTSQRVYRELTPEEEIRLDTARQETLEAQEAILSEGRQRKKAWESMRREVERTIDALRAERERLGFSLEEARENIREAIELYLDCSDEPATDGVVIEQLAL